MELIKMTAQNPTVRERIKIVDRFLDKAIEIVDRDSKSSDYLHYLLLQTKNETLYLTETNILKLNQLH